MFYNLKIMFRNLYRDGLYSIINIAGLAVSLAICILIILWVRDELSINRNFKNADRICTFGRNSPGNLAPFIEQNIPEVLHTCRVFSRLDLGVLSSGDEKFTESEICLVDSSFFSVFDPGFIKGDPALLFKDKYSVILSESLAKTLFNGEDPIGKSIQSDKYGIMHVTAVMADFPQNSSLQYRMILPFTLYPDVAAKIGYSDGKDWSNWYFTTYGLLAENVDLKALRDKMDRMVWKEVIPEEAYVPGTWLSIPIQSLTTLGLYDSEGAPSGIKNVRLFSAAAFILLLIAAINYVNLVTARLTKRAKEASIRKILGSGRIKLFLQMMYESGLVFVLSVILATILIFLLLPFYNELTDKQLQLELFSPSVLLIYLILAVVIILGTGIYPAFMLSSFKAGNLSGSATSVHGKSYVRKILVTVQFVFSIGLILITIGLGSQLNYLRQKDPGYTQENIFVTRMYNMQEHYSTVKNELLQQGTIPDVTATNIPVNDVWWNISRKWQCKDESKEFGTAVLSGDYNLLDFFNIKLLSGRKFTLEDHPHGGYIVNKQMAEKLGWPQVVGRTIPLYSDEESEIVGETDDFNFRNFHSKIGPIVISYSQGGDYLYVKSAPGKSREAIAAVETIWKRYNEGYPFDYQFMDEEFDQMYKSDIRTGNLFNAFSLIAVFISCLGLFGLVTYTAETKTKEIGIRKVLGASVGNIVRMLSNEFLILIGIAMLIAFPVAYYWLDKMLQDYAYRISVGWWIFATAALIIIALTLLTVVWQAVKAATANPVNSIKSE